MPLINCLTKISFSAEEQKYILNKSKALQQTGLSEAEAEIAAVKELQAELISNLKEIYAQLDIPTTKEVKTKSGKEVVRPAQVLIPWNYKGKLALYKDAEGYIDTTKLPPELLERFGFRIPNQGHNSMALIEVVGFLPEGMNDMVIASRDFIVQMGSDYDVDKLYIYDYYVNEENGVIRRDKLDNVKANKNQILDIHKAVVSNPKVFDYIVTPLGNSKDDPSAIELKALLKKKKEVLNYLNPDYKKDKYLESVDGKAMVGLESLASTFNTVIQEVEGGMHYQKKVGKDKYEEDHIVFGDAEGRRIYLSELTNPLNIAGRTKNSVNSAGQSAAVDNEKDPILFYLNRNPITFPALTALRQLGLTEDYINWLLNQEDIRDVTNTLKQAKRAIGQKKKVFPKRVVKNKMRELALAYVTAQPNYDPKNLGNEISDAIEKAKDYALTIAEMKENFKNPDPKISFYAMVKFQQAFELGKDLMEIQGSISIESKGVGKSVLEVANKRERIQRLSALTSISNATAILHNGSVTEHTITNGLEVANDLLNDADLGLFQYQSPAFRESLKMIERLRMQSGETMAMTDDETLQVWDHLKSFLIADSLDVKERDRIFMGPDSLAHRVRRLLLTKEGKRNPFLVRLAFDMKGGPKAPTLINYLAAKEENVDELNIYRGFIELFQSPNEDTRQIGEDLVTYFYLNGGIQRAKEWGKYIHPAILKGYKNGEFLKKLENLNFKEEGITGPDGNGLSAFVQQYFRHHPWLLQRVDTKKKKQYSFEGGKLIIPKKSTAITEEKQEPPQMIAYQDGQAARGYRVYRLEEVDKKGNLIYERLGALGRTDFTEYSGNRKPTSLVNKNWEDIPVKETTKKVKVKVVEPKPIPNKQFASLEGPIGEVFGKFKEGKEATKKWKPLTDVLKEIEYEGNIVVFQKDDPAYGRFAGFYDHKTKNVYVRDDSNMLDKILLHEIVHAAAHDKMNTPAAAAFRKIADTIWRGTLKGEYTKYGLHAAELSRASELERRRMGDGKPLSEAEREELADLSPKYYGLMSVDTAERRQEEFLTMLMTEQVFQDILNKIPYDGDKSFLDRIIEVIAKMLSPFKAEKGSAYEAALAEAITFMKGTTSKAKAVISADENFDTNLEPVTDEEENPFVEEPPVEKKSKRRSMVDRAKTDGAVDPSLLMAPAKKKSTEYVKVIDMFDSRLKFIDISIAKAVNAKDFAKAEALKLRREEVAKEVEDFKANAILDTLNTLATKDLEKVKALLKEPKLSFNDLNYALRALKMWTELDELVLTDQDKKDDSQRFNDVHDIMREATKLYSVWAVAAKAAMLEAVKSETGMEQLTKQILEEQERVDMLTGNTMDISRVGSTLLSVMDKWMRTATKKGIKEAQDIEEELDAILVDLQKHSEFKQNGYYIFAQKSKAGELTGELVRPLQYEYYKTRQDLFQKALDTKGWAERAENWKDYFKWMKENHNFLEVAKLFKETNNGYTYSPDEAYLKEAEAIFGEDLPKLLEQQQDLIKEYNERLGLVQESIDKDDPDAYRIVEAWKLKNDPAIYLDNVVREEYSKTIVDKKPIRQEGYKYVIKRAKDEWEDAQYNKIQKDETLKKFYDFSIITLNRLYSFLPAGFKDGITPATIPAVPKALLETMTENGMGAGFSQGWNKLIEGLSVSDQESQTSALQDPLTKKPELSFRVRFLNGLSPTEKSYDLGKVIKAFAGEASAFKHKSATEDAVRLAQSILEESKEIARSAKGEEIKNSRLKENLRVNDLKVLKDQVEYAVESWYGKRKPVQGTTSKKIYTNNAKSKYDTVMADVTKEKFTKESIAIIREMGYPVMAERMAEDPSKATLSRVETIMTEHLSRNTRYVAGSKVGDSLLKYMQLKGMGWNIFSSFTNASFGLLSNYNWAAGGRDFDTKQMLKAQRIMLSSMLRSASLDLADNPTAQKVNSLMRKFDVLKEFNEDAFDPTTNANAIRRGIDKLSPFELQRRGEYLVQGMTMVALMLNTKVTVDGKETNLWEAYDKKGNFKGEDKAGWQGDINNKEENKNHFNFSNKLDQINKAIHGNYDPNSAVRMKKGILGRAVMQFRSWIAEGAANRFEGKKYDLLLGRERKGRWRTYADLGLKGSIQGLFKAALGKDLKGTGPTGEDELTIENLKRNLVEIYQTLTLMGLYFLLKGIEFEDDDEWGKRSTTFMINQILRLQDDIEFYYSPMALENITQNAVPVFTLVRDSAKFIEAVGDGIINDEWDYKGGPKRGQNKVLWTGAKILPLSSTMSSFINKTESEEGFRK
jgi:hypothetical protein